MVANKSFVYLRRQQMLDQLAVERVIKEMPKLQYK